MTREPPIGKKSKQIEIQGKVPIFMLRFDGA
jgi:hypothetical protein